MGKGSDSPRSVWLIEKLRRRSWRAWHVLSPEPYYNSSFYVYGYVKSIQLTGISMGVRPFNLST